MGHPYELVPEPESRHSTYQLIIRGTWANQNSGYEFVSVARVMLVRNKHLEARSVEDDES